MSGLMDSDCIYNYTREVKTVFNCTHFVGLMSKQHIHSHGHFERAKTIEF